MARAIARVDVAKVEDTAVRFAVAEVNGKLPLAFAQLWYARARIAYDDRRLAGKSYEPPAVSPTDTPEAQIELAALLRVPLELFHGQEAKGASVLSDRGRVESLRGRHEQAAAFHARASELQPDNPVYAVRHGFAVFNDPLSADAARMLKSRRIFERAAAKAPYSAAARFALGCSLYEAREFEQARKEVEAALRAQPDHARANALLTKFGPKLRESEPRAAGIANKLRRFWGG